MCRGIYKICTLLLLLPLLTCVSTVPAPALTVSTCENSQSRIGESHYTVVFNLFKFGDGGITAAMNAGNIDSVHHVDIQTREYFIFRRVYTWVVGAGRGAVK